MAAYNAAPYITSAIQSVLDQSLCDFELLIVNDGSTDKTVEIIKNFCDPRIRLIENDRNRGLGFTRNVALKEAKGEFLAILDSDDIANPYRLEKQLAYLDKHPDVAIVGGSAHIIDINGNKTGDTIIPPNNSDRMRAILLFTNTFVHSTATMRTAVFREIGGYPDHTVAQDYGLFVRIAQKHKVENLPEYLVDYRMHDSNITLRKKNSIRQELKEILSYQLNLLSIDHEDIYTATILDPIQQSTHSIDRYYTVYKRIILQNRKINAYPPQALEQLIMEKWFTVIMEKGRAKTFGLLFKRPIFSRKSVTFKQIRKAFKRSLRHILKIEK